MLQTCSIVSVERRPGSVTSVSDARMMEVIRENLLFSSREESIKFQSSYNEVKISFNCRLKQVLKLEEKDK